MRSCLGLLAHALEGSPELAQWVVGLWERMVKVDQLWPELHYESGSAGKDTATKMVEPNRHATILLFLVELLHVYAQILLVKCLLICVAAAGSTC